MSFYRRRSDSTSPQYFIHFEFMVVFFCWGNLDPNQKMGPSFMSPCNLQLTIAMKESYAWIQIHTPSVGYYHVGSHWTPLRIRFKKKRKYMSSCVYTSVPKCSGILLFFFIDIDECARGTHNCHSSRASCTNTVGSFSCSCNSPYTGDGRTCNLVSGNLQCAIVGKRSLLKTFTPSLTVRKTPMRITKIIY